MKTLILLSFFLSFHGSVFSSDRIYYVTPVDEGGTCDVGGYVLEPCLPLTNYTSDMLTSNESHHINITMLFLPGEHLITSQYKLCSKNIDTIMMLPYNGSGNVTVTCAGNGEVNMYFHSLKIHSLSFLSCAESNNILTIFGSLELSNCSFHDNTHGILYIETSERTTVSITASNFTHNDYNSSFFEGYLISMQARSQEMNFTIRDCIFDNNKVDNVLFVNKIESLELYGNTFTNNTVKQVLHVGNSIKRLTVSHCSYKNNNIDGSRALNIRSCQILELNHCIFFNNSGGAAQITFISELVLVSDCTFINNRAEDLLFMIEAETLELINCTAINNTVEQVVYARDFASLMVRACHFGNNSVVDSIIIVRYSISRIGYYGKFKLKSSSFFKNGGRAVEVTQGSAYISGCTFDSNDGETATLFVNEVDRLDITNCSFTNSNTVHVTDSQSLILRHSLFGNNSGVGSRTLNVRECQKVEINNCIFFNNSKGAVQIQSIPWSAFIKTYFIHNKALEGGGIHFSHCKQFILNDVNFTNNTAVITGGAIYAEFSLITTPPNSLTTIIINSNTAGSSGGGIVLAKGSVLKLSHESNIYFSSNRVTAPDGKGGAIFVPNDCSAENNVSCPIVHSNTGKYLHFDDNHAVEGSIIYGGKLDTCSAPSEVNKTWSGLLKLIISKQILDDFNFSHAITSDVAELCFCIENFRDCALREMNMSKYPGGTIAIFVENFNELHKPVSSIIKSYYNDSRVSLKRDERTQSVSARCQEMKFHVYSQSPPKTSVELIIENLNPCNDLKGRLIVNLDIEQCPHGFELSDDHCICDKRLLELLEECDIDLLTGRSTGIGWFEFNKQYLKINKHYCPLGYCTKNNRLLHDQCANNRQGVLCGACADNYSIGLGSWRCLQCTHSQYNFIWLVPLIATAGVVLVVFLLLLKLTVSSGTINGLVFYANVISVSRLTNLPHCSINPLLSVFISWTNLDFGIETCFYSGMDAYQKTWLQFFFPLYIWFLVGIIIIVCHYSSRAMKLMGKRCIDILATLFLLSYAKLLKTIINALSSVNIMIAKADNVSDPLVPHKVWTYDGNVDYLTGKHLPLFVVALFFLVFLFLPYTLLLTFGQCLRSLPRKRGLRWVGSTTFISVMDAYHAPYNRRHHYWTGLTLCALLTVFAANTNDIVTANKFTTVIITSLLLIRLITANTVYQNYFIDKLDLSFLINLEFLVMLFLYLDNGDRGEEVYCKVVKASVSLSFITFIGIVLYHLYLKVQDKRLFKKIVNQLKKCKYHPAPVAVESTPDNSSRTTTSFFQLRESLLESTELAS